MMSHLDYSRFYPKRLLDLQMQIIDTLHRPNVSCAQSTLDTDTNPEPGTTCRNVFVYYF